MIVYAAKISMVARALLSLHLTWGKPQVGVYLSEGPHEVPEDGQLKQTLIT